MSDKVTPEWLEANGYTRKKAIKSWHHNASDEAGVWYTNGTYNVCYYPVGPTDIWKLSNMKTYSSTQFISQFKQITKTDEKE